MLRDDNVFGGKIETPVVFVIGGVSEENTSCGPMCQFMSGFGGEIGIAGATEHTQVLIGGGNSMKSEVWTGRDDCLGGEAVQYICGGVEPFHLVASRNRSLKEQGVQHIIINGVKDTLHFTVQWRNVWIRHPQNHPFGDKEYARGRVVELMTIVTLDDFDGAVKLCGDISETIWQSGKGERFNIQRKSPHKMGVVIKDN
jgi:hypothetical protein